MVAGRMGWDEAQVKKLAAELVEALSSMGAMAAAATVAVQYLADLDNGVSLLTQAREWREALRVAYKSVFCPTAFNDCCSYAQDMHAVLPVTGALLSV